MAEISITQTSELSPTKRLDSEYFLPERIKANRIIRSFPNLTNLRKITTKITQGPNPRFALTGIPCLNGKNIYFGTSHAGEPNYVSNDEYKKYHSFQLHTNDIVITLKHATKIGRSWIISDNAKKMFSRNVGLIRPRLNSQIRPSTLLFYLWAKQTQLLLDRIATGGTSGQITLPVTPLKNLQIPIFSDKFQELLEKCLIKYQELIKKIEENEKDAMKIFLNELGLTDWKPKNKLTFESNLKSVFERKRMDAEYYNPKFKELSKKLRGKEFEKLEKLSFFKKGIEVGSALYTTSGIPFWRVSNITREGLDESGLVYISNQTYSDFKDKFEPKKGELLLTKDATPGVPYYLDEPITGIISSGVLRLKILDTIPPFYLETAINSFVVQFQIEQDMGGSVIKHWSPEKAGKTLIPRIDTKKENRINNLIEKSHEMRSKSNMLLNQAKESVDSAIDKKEEKAISNLTKII